MRESIVCTNYDGHYEYGAGALINSLVSVNFIGKIIILYGDKLPFWENQLLKEDSEYAISGFPYIKILLRKVETDIHLAYNKPYMIHALMEEFPESNLFYFDPDITVIGDWTFYENWVNCGVALCLDECYPIMPFHHPFKKDYQTLFGSLGYDLVNPNDYYINSGFIGVNPGHKSLIKCWMDFTQHLKDEGHYLYGLMEPSVKKYHASKRLNTICGDQDIINAALLYTKLPLSIMGQEAMGFTPAGFTMNHNTKNPKTWKRNFLKEFIRKGIDFTPKDQAFLNNSIAPINLYSRNQRLLINYNKLITKILQRIF